MKKEMIKLINKAMKDMKKMDTEKIWKESKRRKPKNMRYNMK